MVVATIIKIALISTGIFTGILAVVSFIKRSNSPEFGIIWTLSGRGFATTQESTKN